MVTVVDYKERERKNGDMFYVLEVQQGVEIIKSRITGKPYFTARKVTVPCTFGEQMCISLIGKEYPGRIEKEECDPYEYEIEATGEMITLSHHNVYVDDELDVLQEHILEPEEVQ